MANITGTPGPDTLTGTAGSDTIDGLGGDDTIDGAGGYDFLFGGDGFDRLTGHGELSGGTGRDWYFIAAANTLVIELANEGEDTVFSDFSYTLPAHVENLTLTGVGAVNATGNSGNNVLTGNDSDNLFNGGGGEDAMAGRGGNDTYFVDSAGDQVFEQAGGGTDLVRSSVSFTLSAYVDNLALTGSAAIDGTGNGQDNILTGNNAANVLDGAGGVDKLVGRDGDDTYIVDDTFDRVVENAGQGHDTVQSSRSFTLSDHVEDLVLTTSRNIDATGNGLDNLLVGNNGNNILDGRAGADTMNGGLGNDTYNVDNAGDAVTENPGSGNDTVRSLISYTLGDNLENLTLLGGTAIDATGNALANVLTGNAGANVLNGLGGNDTMQGGDGNDTYVVDSTGDIIVEWPNRGTDLVLSSATYTLSINVENLVLIGPAAIDGTGNAHANFIVGNDAANSVRGESGADRLEARDGDDQLFGGLGNDLLFGQAGADGFRFDTALNATSNVDTLADFLAADDTVFLSNTIFAAAGPTGTLVAGAFHLGNSAAEADDRILYDSATGFIYYDADGIGGTAAVLFAKVAAGTALTEADFVIYG